MFLLVTTIVGSLGMMLFGAMTDVFQITAKEDP